MPTEYVTDGARLYEIVSQRVIQGNVWGKGATRYTILRDCSSGHEQAVELTGDDTYKKVIAAADVADTMQA